VDLYEKDPCILNRGDVG